MITTIETDLGVIYITANKDVVSIQLDQNVMEYTVVTCLNAGSPGIIGPDIPFVMRDIVRECVEEASKEDWD